ncbi:hypothetical protein [Dyella sp. 2RAB6]|uniref:hypothetical protein n=1 Tax=Dyella sp. 2RAB6 TaxID=3232992 RepID=UPI003F90989A
MFRLVSLLLLCMLTVVGCTEWFQPGISSRQRDRELASCKADGYRRFPVEQVVVPHPVHYEFSTRICRDHRDQKEGKWHKECTYVPGYWMSPSASVVDANSDARDAVEDDCMYRRGYIKK